MMMKPCTRIPSLGKALVAILCVLVAACTINPATGEKQFTAFLPEGQENSLGQSEHEKVQQTYGDFVTGPVADYVNRVGQKLAANTERTDVQYKFFVLDSPIVNAFAVPGGYIYVSRGILALANTEDELAGVLAHEIGHITARHTASRVSQGMLVGLGAAVLSAAVGSDAVGQVANVGSDLYIKSYSRSQESQADQLGVRYLSRAGYDTAAMATFLHSLDRQTNLDQKLAGKEASEGPSYFSTHPLTADRVAQAQAEAAQYPKARDQGATHETYLSAVNGLVYGDSAAQGFVRGQTFYHTKLGFTFSVPDGFVINNSPSEVVAAHKSGAIVILDSGNDPQKREPLAYLTQVWMAQNPPSTAENIMVNGMRAATAAFAGSANGKPVMIRVVAIEWGPGQYFRFQIAIPESVSTDVVEGLKRTTYSFRRMSESEKSSIHPLRIRTFTASAGDTVSSAAARMAFPDNRQERFMVLNGLEGASGLTPGLSYKLVTE